MPKGAQHTAQMRFGSASAGGLSAAHREAYERMGGVIMAGALPASAARLRAGRGSAVVGLIARFGGACGTAGRRVPDAAGCRLIGVVLLAPSPAVGWLRPDTPRSPVNRCALQRGRRVAVRRGRRSWPGWRSWWRVVPREAAVGLAVCVAVRSTRSAWAAQKRVSHLRMSWAPAWRCSRCLLAQSRRSRPRAR